MRARAVVEAVLSAECGQKRVKFHVVLIQPVLLAAVMVLSLTGAAVLLKKKLLVK